MNTFVERFSNVAEPLLRKGWSPIPCTGKAPWVPWKEYLHRQPSDLEVRAWSMDYPTANTAIVLGTVPGVVAVDFDEDDVVEAMRLGEAADEILGPSPVVRVGRYPRHVRLYRARRVRSRRFGNIEVLGQGHLIMAYGIHPDTDEAYRYPGDALINLRPTDLPRITARQVEQLRDEVLRLDAQVPQHGAIRGMEHSSDLTLDECLGGVKQGHRNQAMVKIAAIFRAAGKPEAEAIKAVLDAASRCSPPYPTRDAESAVRWCYRAVPAGPSQTRNPRGDSPPPIPRVLRIAKHRAEERLDPMVGGSRLYQTLIAMARDLQNLTGAAPIGVPQPTFARLLKCTPQYVSMMLRRAQRDGFLTLANPAYKPGAVSKLYYAN